MKKFFSKSDPLFTLLLIVIKIRPDLSVGPEKTESDHLSSSVRLKDKICSWTGKTKLIDRFLFKTPEPTLEKTPVWNLL